MADVVDLTGEPEVIDLTDEPEAKRQDLSKAPPEIFYVGRELKTTFCWR
eukprot:SAG22_NODE_1946_length_3279_cov_1.645283_4_plen_49_part_00